MKLKLTTGEILFLTLLLLFSTWLMFNTFGYKDNTFRLGSKVWSDFGSHIPLIRSFSQGSNFPKPEYPLFPGEPIRYHYLFYFLVGLLEKTGLNIAWALNLPSTLGFWGLLTIIYLLTRQLFNRKGPAVLAVVLFLFNSSLSLLEFFRLNPLPYNILPNIITNTDFPSFGPYDGKIVSAFWNLNIYTNQRHLAWGYFFVLLVIYWLVTSKDREREQRPEDTDSREATILRSSLRFLPSILIVGLLPSFHKAAFLMAGTVLGMMFIFFPKRRRNILITLLGSGLLALPQLIPQLNQGQASGIKFHFGYLIEGRATILKFVDYWWQNFGLSCLLIPLGFILAPQKAKKILLAAAPLFIIGNLFQFSREIAANHKFFNLFVIIGNMFSAWAVYLIWQKRWPGKVIASSMVVFLTLSGLIDLFPIINDTTYIVEDAPRNEAIFWVENNTPPNATFLNSGYLYHPASLAGRPTFLGWPYFSWSLGYDTDTRFKQQKEILGAVGYTKKSMCARLEELDVDYIALGRTDEGLVINWDFWSNNFESVYQNKKSGLTIFSVAGSCGTGTHTN